MTPGGVRERKREAVGQSMKNVIHFKEANVMLVTFTSLSGDLLEDYAL